MRARWSETATIGDVVLVMVCWTVAGMAVEAARWAIGGLL